MTRMLKILRVVGACGALLAVSGAGALGQGQMPGRMPGMGMMEPGMMGSAMMRMMAECPLMMGGNIATYSDGRIAFLKAELAITDAQKAVWDAYAAAVTQNLQEMQATRATMMKAMEAKSPVERLDSHLAAMEGGVAALTRVKPGLAALYSSLNDDQKKKADDLLTGMGCMM